MYLNRIVIRKGKIDHFLWKNFDFLNMGKCLLSNYVNVSMCISQDYDSPEMRI